MPDAGKLQKQESEARSQNTDKVLIEMKDHDIAVWMLVFEFCKLLNQRGLNHDASKSSLDELTGWLKYGSSLKGLTYGSGEYKAVLEFLRPTIELHYRANRHHPEHFKNGVDDMNLVDLVEMLCDWKAATLRHDDGNIRRSLELNANRFKMSPQLVKIFENTFPLVEAK